MTSNNVFLLEKRARGRNSSSIIGKNWKWRTFKLTGQTLEYFDVDKLKGSYDTNQSVARECYTMECRGKSFAFTIQNKTELFFLNASSELIRQTCINVFNRSSTNPDWNNVTDNQQAVRDIDAKIIELVSWKQFYGDIRRAIILHFHFVLNCGGISWCFCPSS